MKNKRFAPSVLGLMVVLGLMAYPFLPDQVPSHWNAAGQVDGYLGRFWGTALLPLIAFGMWLLLLALPKLDPRRANYAAFSNTYQLFVNVLLLFLAAMYSVTLLAALGWAMPVPRLVVAGVGVLFVVMGNEMGRVQPNFFVGIRTPWTLADPEVWRRTHRVLGRAMVAAGLANVLAAIVLPEQWLVVVVIAGALGFTALSFVYSYRLWRQLHAA